MNRNSGYHDELTAHLHTQAAPRPHPDVSRPAPVRKKKTDWLGIALFAIPAAMAVGAVVVSLAKGK